MAYDPEARKQSNSAITIGLITLAVVGLGALAYFATRQPAETSPVIMTREKETIIQATPVPQVNNIIIMPTPVPAPDVPNTIIVTPPANVTTRNAEPAPRAPVANPPADEPNTTVNNTIINPPAPSGQAKPVKPDAAPIVPNTAPPVDNNSVVGY